MLASIIISIDDLFEILYLYITPWTPFAYFSYLSIIQILI